jgi:hypothetical protein
MSRWIGHVTLCSRRRIGFLVYPGLRVFSAQLGVAPSGAAMGVVLAERLTPISDAWEFLLIELGSCCGS